MQLCLILKDFVSSYKIFVFHIQNREFDQSIKNANADVSDNWAIKIFHRLCDRLSKTLDHKQELRTSLDDHNDMIFSPLLSRLLTANTVGRKVPAVTKQPDCDNRSDPIPPHNCTIRDARSLKNWLLCFLNPTKKVTNWANNLRIGRWII